MLQSFLQLRLPVFPQDLRDIVGERDGTPTGLRRWFLEAPSVRCLLQ